MAPRASAVAEPVVTPDPQDAMSREVRDTPASEMSSFEDAFAAAKAAQAAPVEEEVETEEEPEPSPEPEEKPEPEVKAAPGDKPAEATGLLSDEEFTALQTKFAKDPIKLRGELEKAFTQKTQKLADERRSLERLRSYTDVIDGLEADPEATLRQLADQYGVSLAAPKTDEVVVEATAAAKAAAESTDAIVAKFRESLGPELEYLADGLAPAIKGLVETLTKSTVDAATQPLRAAQETILTKAATDQTDRVMMAFGEKHPEWKTHEEAMFKLSQTLEPKGLDELSYLEVLFDTVTRDSRHADLDKRVAEGVKTAMAKMQKGADTFERRQEAVPEGRVMKGPPAAPTFEEAFEAAKRGERWT